MANFTADGRTLYLNKAMEERLIWNDQGAPLDVFAAVARRAREQVRRNALSRFCSLAETF